MPPRGETGIPDSMFLWKIRKFEWLDLRISMIYEDQFLNFGFFGLRIRTSVHLHGIKIARNAKIEIWLLFRTVLSPAALEEMEMGWKMIFEGNVMWSSIAAGIQQCCVLFEPLLTVNPSRTNFANSTSTHSFVVIFMFENRTLHLLLLFYVFILFYTIVRKMRLSRHFPATKSTPIFQQLL